eukprot:772658-Rhodomonas_salina.4
MASVRGGRGGCGADWIWLSTMLKRKFIEMSTATIPWSHDNSVNTWHRRAVEHPDRTAGRNPPGTALSGTASLQLSAHPTSNVESFFLMVVSDTQGELQVGEERVCTFDSS